MQDLAYLIVSGKKILVLRRWGKKIDTRMHIVDLKLRTSGKDGKFLTDESLFLEDNPNILAKLLNGEVIHL